MGATPADRLVLTSAHAMILVLTAARGIVGVWLAIGFFAEDDRFGFGDYFGSLVLVLAMVSLAQTLVALAGRRPALVAVALVEAALLALWIWILAAEAEVIPAAVALALVSVVLLGATCVLLRHAESTGRFTDHTT